MKDNRPCPENSACVQKGGNKHECECFKGYEYNWQKILVKVCNTSSYTTIHASKAS